MPGKNLTGLQCLPKNDQTLERGVVDAALPDKKHVTLLANQTFTNEVRECALELSILEVDAGKVGPDIHTVARHLYQNHVLYHLALWQNL